LGDDADAKSLGFQQTPHDCHAEASLIHIGIAGNDDDVATIPAEVVHFVAAHGQEWGRGELVRPVLAVTENIFGCGVHAQASFFRHSR